jgi:hypothetical protein
MAINGERENPSAIFAVQLRFAASDGETRQSHRQATWTIRPDVAQILPSQ